MDNQPTIAESEIDSATPGESIPRRLLWVAGAWAVVAIAVVAWVLPPGRDDTGSDTPVADRLSASTLAQRGYRAMEQRESDPSALDRALIDFERSHALDPDRLDTRFGLAWARQVKGLPESGWRELYEGTIGEASVLVYLSLYNLAYAERQAGGYAQAVALMERALRVMPDRADGWLELGRAREAAGQSAGAAEAFRRAEELTR